MRPIANIPAAAPFRLEKDQLAQVLCQIRFSPVLLIRRDDAVIAFQEAIRHTYPRYERQQQTTMLITPGGVQQQAADSPLHRFDDSKGVFTAVLSPEFVALETKQYADIDDFVSRVVDLARIVEELYEPDEIQRVGFRFINELRLTSLNPKDEMRAAIAPELLGSAGSDELVEAVFGVQQVLELAGDESRMLVRHGLFPLGGTTVNQTPMPQAPAEHTHPFYRSISILLRRDPSATASRASKRRSARSTRTCGASSRGAFAGSTDAPNLGRKSYEMTASNAPHHTDLEPSAAFAYLKSAPASTGLATTMFVDPFLAASIGPPCQVESRRDATRRVRECRLFDSVVVDRGTRVVDRFDYGHLLEGTSLVAVYVTGRVDSLVKPTRMARIRALAQLSLRDWATVFVSATAPSSNGSMARSPPTATSSTACSPP